MKNILIITSTQDNQGSNHDFIEDINDIKDADVKEMIENAILLKDWEKNDLWSNEGLCGSNRGYIFNQDAKPLNFPMQVNHIVHYCF